MIQYCMNFFFFEFCFGNLTMFSHYTFLEDFTNEEAPQADEQK